MKIKYNYKDIINGIKSLDNNNEEEQNLFLVDLISKSVETIPEWAWSSSSQKINDYAFSYCDLVDVTIPDNIITIGTWAFSNCTSLTNVTIPNSVTDIGWHAFYNTAYYNNDSNWDNQTLYIDKYLVDIKRNANLGDFYIKESTRVIAQGIFSYNNIIITSLTIPDSVTKIFYGHDFKDNINLETIIIGNSVTDIGMYAFENCTNLTNVTIGNSVTNISRNAFEGCTSLTNVTIPNSVTDIGAWAFGNCTSLTNVTIGNSVIDIKEYAFEECTSLTNVTIPNSVTTIGSWAFSDCTSLTNVTIGSGITEINARAFENCTNLTTIYLYSTTPPILGFYAIPNAIATIHVPVGSGDAYKSATNWSEYADIIIEDIVIEQNQ